VKISVIIPFLNESDNLPILVDSLNAFFGKNTLFETEIIFVDDGSSDDSIKVLHSLTFIGYTGVLVKLSRNFGSHAALRAGTKIASGDYLVNTNADLQDPLSLIPILFEKCEQGADIVWAHRKNSNLAFFDRIFSNFYSYLVRKFINPNYPKMGLDVVMFSKKIKSELDENPELNSSFFLQIMNFGFKQDQIYFIKEKRKKGKSKWTFSKKVKLMVDTFIAFSFAPIRMVTIIGISLSIIGFIWTIYIILRQLIVGDLASGWPALISILLIGFGVTNLALGILAEYLWRTLDASRNRKPFIIENYSKLN
jgi:dolichol-phosphate mannosyltransferase